MFSTSLCTFLPALLHHKQKTLRSPFVMSDIFTSVIKDSIQVPTKWPSTETNRTNPASFKHSNH